MSETQTTEDLLKLLKTKIDVLKITNDETSEILGQRNVVDMERQKKTLSDQLQELHTLKVQIQEVKLGEGRTAEEVRQWTGGARDS